MVDYKKYFDNYSLLTSTCWNELKKILTAKTIKKGEIFCKEKLKYNNEFLVVKGVIRAYYSTFENDEVTVTFFIDEQFGTPYFYRTLKNLSTINLQAVEETKIIEFNADKFAELMRKYSDLSNFGMKIVELELKSKIDKEINLLCRSAVDRYKYFQILFPGLENRIPHYYIASYLGITPISLSRIRNNNARK